MEFFNQTQYYGLLVSGRLRAAVDYLARFPQKAALKKRLEERMTASQPVERTREAWLGAVDGAYQTYYREVFWRELPKEDCALRLAAALSPLAGGGKNPAGTAEEQMEAVEDRLTARLEELGFHFLGGQTQGWYGPYIWTHTVPQTYRVELPGQVRDFTVMMMDGFVSRSWLDYISLGKTGAGGWQSGDMTLWCVRKCYRLNSRGFQVSFLKHEAQHTLDRELFPGLSSVLLEYRAKLVELIYASRLNRLTAFLAEADPSHPENSHSYASYLLVRDLSRAVFDTEYVSEPGRWKGKLPQMRKAARALYDRFDPAEMSL